MHGKLISRNGVPVDSVSDNELVTLSIYRAYELAKQCTAEESNITDLIDSNDNVPIYLWHSRNSPERLNDEIVKNYMLQSKRSAEKENGG